METYRNYGFKTEIPYTILPLESVSQCSKGVSMNFIEHLRVLKSQQSPFIIKIKLRSFKSREHINEKKDGPYRGFGYLSLFSDP